MINKSALRDLEINWANIPKKVIKRRLGSQVHGRSDLIFFGQDTSTRGLRSEIKFQRSILLYNSVADVLKLIQVSVLHYGVN